MLDAINDCIRQLEEALTVLKRVRDDEKLHRNIEKYKVDDMVSINISKLHIALNKMKITVAELKGIADSVGRLK